MPMNLCLDIASDRLRGKAKDRTVEVRFMIRRFASATLVAMLLSGCSTLVQDERRPPSVGGSFRPLPSATNTPFKSRRLVDLKKKVKGKVIISHVDEKAEQANWTADIRINNAYVVAVDCVGPEGKLNVKTTSGLSFLRQCVDGYTTVTIDNYPQKPSKAHQLTVNAPPGAKWAILIVRLP
jgi:hypothetical protein